MLQHYQLALDILTGQNKEKESATGSDCDSCSGADIKGTIVGVEIGMVGIWMDPS